MSKSESNQEREPRPEHLEIVHALVKLDSADSSSITILNASRQPDGITADQAEEIGVSMFEEALTRLEQGYRENNFEDNAGVYRLLRTKVMIPPEPSCPMWMAGGFEIAPEWRVHRETMEVRVADPSLWKDALIVRERLIGAYGSIPRP
jgi:hypothetical protein